MEIKNLSADIEIDDQSNSNEEHNENEINAADENVIEDFKQQTENEDANVEIERQTITRSITRNYVALKKVSTTDGVKYACSQCDKQYFDRSSLRKHIQSKHEGVKYACNQCEYQATQQNNLKTHIHSVHEKVKYACDQCDYQATRPDHLKSHLMRKHILRN